MSRRSWTVSSCFIDYSAVNSEHNWEDLRIWLKNREPYTFDFLLILMKLYVRNRLHINHEYQSAVIRETIIRQHRLQNDT